jgi:hypothetical protein
VRELFDPRDLTLAEATRILGSKIGKPDLQYVQFPDDGVVAGLKGRRHLGERRAQLRGDVRRLQHRKDVSAPAAHAGGHRPHDVRVVRRGLGAGLPEPMIDLVSET